VLTPGAVCGVASLVILAAVLVACSPEPFSREVSDGEGDALTVMSANIYLGGRKDPGLDGIACYLSNADIAYLQEVDEEGARALARMSGLNNLRFAKDEGMKSGEFGVAILSKFPLRRAEVRKLTGTEPGYDVILKTTSKVRGKPVDLITSIYQAGYDQEGKRGRLAATKAVLDMVDRAQKPVVFGGDLNASSERPGIPELEARMTDSFQAAPEDRYHCPEPFGRIDYIFFRGPFAARGYDASCWPLEGSEVPKPLAPGCSLDDATLSDHPFVRVELETTKGRRQGDHAKPKTNVAQVFDSSGRLRIRQPQDAQVHDA
jgi:endonuclease/exonuclease/phosphatase family metal-dependent hydrolase